MQTHSFTLPNGLSVLLVDTNAFPSLTTLLLVGAGSRYENKANNGVAHFLEHMFFKGSKKYPNPYIISSTIEGLGGVWNAFTSKDYTGYYIKAPNEHFDTVVDILSDILLHPILEPTEIEKEKGVITEEINMYEDMPQNKVGELFENLLYEGNPLGFDVIGTKKTIQNFEKNTFQSYLESLYSPSNAVLIIAGGLHMGIHTKKDLKSYEAQIRAAFGSWQKGPETHFLPIVEKQSKPNVLLHTKVTEQAHFCLGFRTFPMGDKRRYALSILATMLGGGASSKLFTEVREKRGLCYYISTGRQAYADCGYLVTQAGVPKEKDKILTAIKATLDEHKKVAKGEFKQEEINRAKEILKGHLILSLEDSYNVANAFAKKMLFEKNLYSSTEVIDSIERVTYDEILKLAKDILLPEKLNISVIGPVEGKEDFEKIAAS